MEAIHPEPDEFLENYRNAFDKHLGDAGHGGRFLGANALHFLGFDDPTNQNNNRLRARYDGSHPDRVPSWLAGTLKDPPMTSFLDKPPPFDFADPAARDLWDVAGDELPEQAAGPRHAPQVGRRSAEIDWDQPMKWVWADILHAHPPTRVSFEAPVAADHRRRRQGRRRADQGAARRLAGDRHAAPGRTDDVEGVRRRGRREDHRGRVDAARHRLPPPRRRARRRRLPPARRAVRRASTTAPASGSPTTCC